MYLSTGSATNYPVWASLTPNYTFLVPYLNATAMPDLWSYNVRAHHSLLVLHANIEHYGLVQHPDFVIDIVLWLDTACVLVRQSMLRNSRDITRWALLPAMQLSCDYWAALLYTKFQAPYNDTYTFYINSDNGANLYVDSNIIVNNSGRAHC